MEWRNPKRNRLGGIDCEINHPKLGWIPFTVDPDDKGAKFDVKALHDEIIAEDSIAEYVAPQINPDVVIRKRDKLLSESDWTQLGDSSANTAKWKPYRQALRDLPSQEGFPDNVVWPTPPESFGRKEKE